MSTPREEFILKRFGKILLGLLVLLIAFVAISYFLLRLPMPAGKAGPAAEALAKQMQAAVDIKNWNQVGAVTWNFRGRNLHVWDRKRQYVQVTWGSGDSQIKAQFRTSDRQGNATRGGKALTGDDAKKLIRKAYAYWTNDAFWLNPIDTLYAKGTTRQLVTTKQGEKALLLKFSTGGVTPGDSYMFVLDKTNKPKRYHMWVSILPVPGVAATFDGWQTLYNGAKVSSTHKIGGALTLKLTGIKAAADITALVGKDIFAALHKRLNPEETRRPAPRATDPSTQPDKAKTPVETPAQKTEARDSKTPKR